MYLKNLSSIFSVSTKVSTFSDEINNLASVKYSGIALHSEFRKVFKLIKRNNDYINIKTVRHTKNIIRVLTLLIRKEAVKSLIAFRLSHEFVTTFPLSDHSFLADSDNWRHLHESSDIEPNNRINLAQSLLSY